MRRRWMFVIALGIQILFAAVFFAIAINQTYSGWWGIDCTPSITGKRGCSAGYIEMYVVAFLCAGTAIITYRQIKGKK